MGDREEIEALDGKIARLKVEYEQYFMKVLKREPLKLRDEVERAILFYSNRNLTNTSIKFKLNSMVARYNSYKQYWTRVLRAIDEGTYVRKAEAVPEGPVKAGPVAKAVKASEGDSRDTELKEVYERYIEARKKCNEPIEGITEESLAKTIDQFRKKVEDQYRTKDVELKVYVKDGKAKLTITPKKAAS